MYNLSRSLGTWNHVTRKYWRTKVRKNMKLIVGHREIYKYLWLWLYFRIMALLLLSSMKFFLLLLYFSSSWFVMSTTLFQANPPSSKGLRNRKCNLYHVTWTRPSKLLELWTNHFFPHICSRNHASQSFRFELNYQYFTLKFLIYFQFERISAFLYLKYFLWSKF